EKRLAALHAKLPPAKLKAVQAKVARKAAVKTDTVTPKQGAAATKKTALRTLAVHLHPQPRVRSAHDTQKAEKDKARHEALKQAFGGKIPGVPDKVPGKAKPGH